MPLSAFGVGILPPSFDGLDMKRRAGISAGPLFGQNVNIPIRPLLYVSESGMQVEAHGVPALGLGWRMIERHALEHLPIERTQEDMSLPLRIDLRSLDNQAGGRNGRHPVHHRHFHARSVPLLPGNRF